VGGWPLSEPATRPRRLPRPHGPWRDRRGGTTVASCAAHQVARLWRLGEAHRDRKVVGGGAIPLAPTTHLTSRVPYRLPDPGGDRDAPTTDAPPPLPSIPRSLSSRPTEASSTEGVSVTLINTDGLAFHRTGFGVVLDDAPVHRSRGPPSPPSIANFGRNTPRANTSR